MACWLLAVVVAVVVAVVFLLVLLGCQGLHNHDWNSTSGVEQDAPAQTTAFWVDLIIVQSVVSLTHVLAFVYSLCIEIESAHAAQQLE